MTDRDHIDRACAAGLYRATARVIGRDVRPLGATITVDAPRHNAIAIVDQARGVITYKPAPVEPQKPAVEPTSIESRLLMLDGRKRRDALARVAGSVSAGFITPAAARPLFVCAMFGWLSDAHYHCEIARLRATAWGHPHRPEAA